MALSELTRNSFQSGLSASKWLSLCKLFISKNLAQLAHVEIESALSNSVLALFRNYPGDPALIAYLRHAIRDGLLSLAIFISTFLSAARSIDLRNVSTLDTLCRLALDCHYASGMPPIGSVVSFTQSLPEVFNTVLDATALLRTAHDLPQTHLHQLTNTASELLILLLSTIGDVSQIPGPLGLMFLQDMAEMTHSGFRLTPATRHVLDQFTFALHNSIGDDATNETQMVHSFQLTFGKADAVSGPSSGKDIITCGLLLHNMVTHRGGPFSSGDGRRAVVLLVALVRWMAWTPATFYTQLMQSAVACFAQAAANPTSRNAALWRAFIVGRLPHLLVLFEKSVDLDGVSESDWRSAMQIAVTSLFQRSDLLGTCDTVYHRPSGDQSSNGSSSGPTQPFMSELLHQLLTLKLLDQTVVTSINPNLQNDFHPRLQTEAQEHSSDLEAYMESRFNTDLNVEDARPILNKIWKDPCSHATFANVAKKRFKSYSSANDIESLGHMCKILYSHENSLEILSLHVTIQDLLCRALAIIEDYDCETVGDPQAAVTHYGSVVLFVQTAFTKYNLWNLKFTLGERTLSTDLLHFAAYGHRPDELKGEDEKALKSWYKTLFDTGSEGIDDSILRNTRPHSLLRVAATLLITSVNACANEKLDKEALNNGVSYFQGPLLNWTLVGVVKALMRDIKYKLGVINPTIPLAVLRTILETPSCPMPVLKLSAHKILRTFPITPSPFEQSVDPMPFRKVALEALGYPPDEPPASKGSQSEGQPAKPASTPQPDPVTAAIRACVSDARAGKAPALDVEWCLLFTPPVRFLAVLWDELALAAKVGELEAPRLLLTAVLGTPRAPHAPPLLPVFLHVVLPQVVTATDALAPAEQPLAAELAAGAVSGALTAALCVEWALLSVCKEQRLVLGQPALTMARRLSGELRRRPHSPTSTLIMQRLGASPSFMANFPTFMTE